MFSDVKTDFEAFYSTLNPLNCAQLNVKLPTKFHIKVPWERMVAICKEVNS